MQDFVIRPTRVKIIIVRTTGKITVYILNTVKRKKKTNKRQEQFLIIKEEYELLRTLKCKVSKYGQQVTIKAKPKNVLIRNMFFSLKDILVGSISGAIGTLVTPKFQEFSHYLEGILSQLF